MAFSEKLDDPNSTWTAFEKSLINGARLFDNLSATVVANLYARLKKLM